MADTEKKTAKTPAPGRKVKVTRKERRARTEAAPPEARAARHARASSASPPARSGWSPTTCAGCRSAPRWRMLKFTPQAAAPHLAKLLRSAVANAENKGGRVDVDALFVKTLTVDHGPKSRRFMPRAMGRATRIDKKTSHVYVELGIAERA